MQLAIGRATRAVIVALAAAALLSFALPAHAQTKVALVIGNGAYQNVPGLPNPPHDAADIAAAFQRLGFSVQLIRDADYDAMRRALLQFSARAREAEMAVIFFAGHGMEMDGENWLIPIDAELKTDLDMSQEAISLSSIILKVTPASKLGLVILDACRNNPFVGKMRRTIATRAIGRGLSRIEPTNNVLVAYSAKDGTTANDGIGHNSPFTAALLKYLEVPGLEINFLFRDVRDDVIAATRGEQQPFVYGSLSKEAIFFRPPPAASPPPASDVVAWSLIRETTDEAALKRFTTQYPDSPLRKDAEARIAALEAAAAAKPVPPRPDEVTWELLKETTDEGALRRFIVRYPDSPLRKQAEARIAALQAAAAAKPIPPRPDEVTWVLLKDTTDESALKRFITQYPNSPLRKDAEARIAVLEAAAAAKPVPPRPDEVSWESIKETTDESALKRFITQYPNSPLRKDAEARIAALEAAAAAKPVPPRPDEVTWQLLKDTIDESALNHFIARYPDSPLRKEAEARIETLRALRAAQPSPPSPEQVAWNMVKDTTDPDQLRRFIRQFPDSPNRADAEQRATELAAAVAAASTTNTVDPHALALALQFELKRVGCFNGALNGEFDDATRAASRNFARLASVSMPDGLSMDAINAVRGFNKRVCPLVCREGEQAEGDRCIAIAPVRKPEEVRPKEPRNHATTATSAPKSGGKCFSFGGRSFCE
jgi:outer membrane protein assembly factor BamD (BamD/ComL family)